MRKALFTLAVLLAAASAFAGDKYLGNLGGNRFDPNSTSNPYGRYGSPYSADSINNPYGRYGSPYSADSPNNPYAINPPVIRNGRELWSITPYRRR